MTSRLADILGRTDTLLLDFDGPVCNLFAGYPAPAIADELRALVAKYGVTVHAAGPPQLLREVAEVGGTALIRIVADAARDAEVTAAATAEPTTGIGRLLNVAQSTDRRVAIVSNNATEAIHVHLVRHGLAEFVELVIGRYDRMDPRRLKPDTHLVQLALTRLGISPDTAVFVGDSTTDIEAGRNAGVATIGYANKPGKRNRLADAGADVVIESMNELSDVLNTLRTAA